MAAKWKPAPLLLLLSLLSHFVYVTTGLPALQNGERSRWISPADLAQSSAPSVQVVFSLDKSLEYDQVYPGDGRYNGAMVGIATATMYAIGGILQHLQPGHISVHWVKPLDDGHILHEEGVAESPGHARKEFRDTKSFVAHLTLNGVDAQDTSISQLVDAINTASSLKTHPHWHEFSRAVSEVTSHFGLSYLSAKVVDSSDGIRTLHPNNTTHRLLVSQDLYNRVKARNLMLANNWRTFSKIWIIAQKKGVVDKVAKAIGYSQKTTQQVTAVNNAATNINAAQSVAANVAQASSVAQEVAAATPFLLSNKAISIGGAVIMVASTILGQFTSKDPTQDTLDLILRTVQQINATVTETLERVKNLQNQIYTIEDEMMEIEKELGVILAEVKQTECYVANLLVDQVWVDRLKPLWYQYAIGETSVINSITYIVEQFSKADLSDYAQERFDEIIQWAEEVTETAPADLDSIHNFLVDDFLPGTLSMCNTAFMEKWAMRAETERRFPFDDREYYDLITRFLAQKVTYQANGAVMINEAFELLAMNAVMLKGRELNQTVAGYFVSGSFCDFVLGNRGNQSSALFAGYRFCKDKDTFFRKTYDNVVGQIEAVGQPFSWGGPGEGMRLLMGTDHLGYYGLKMEPLFMEETNDISDSWPDLLPKYKLYRGHTRLELPVKRVEKATRFLIPASLSKFDSRCSSSNVDEAEAAGCSLVGTFDSCTHGCGKDPVQEARWRDLTSPLGIPLDAWDVANGSVWLDIEDTITGWVYNNTAIDNSTSYKLDIFRIMEADNPNSRGASFKGMTNRPFWIVNQTTMALFDDLFIDEYPKFRDWDQSGECKIENTVQKWYDNTGPYDLDRPMDFYELNAHYPAAWCFAISIPESEATNSSWFVRPSGIHCSSVGFRELYDRNCFDFPNGKPCAYGDKCEKRQDSRKRRCEVKLKPSLRQRDDGALRPADGRSGVAYSGCAWSWVNLKTPDREPKSCPIPRLAHRWSVGCGLTDSNFFLEPEFNKDRDVYMAMGNSYNFKIQHQIEYEAGKTGAGVAFGNVLFANNFSFPGFNTREEFAYPWFSDPVATNLVHIEVQYPPYNTIYNSTTIRFDESFEPLNRNKQPWPQPSQESRRRKMFRLPYVDLQRITCTPSPFVNAGHQEEPNAPRPRTSAAGIITPCDDLMTQAVINLVGPGYYSAMSYGSNAMLEIADNADTISCNVDWATNVYTTNMYIKIRDGPVYADESIGGTGNVSNPLWASRELDLYEGANSTDLEPLPTRLNVSLWELFPANTSTFNTRIISCTVVGVDRDTFLPVTITAVSKLITVLETPADGRRRHLAEQASEKPWQDFFYPLHTGPCYDPGCIATVASGLEEPSWVAQGPAGNWAGHETENDTLFILVNGGLQQIAPSTGDIAKHPDAVNNAIQATALGAIISIVGFQADNSGALVLAGNYSAGATGGSIIVVPWDASAGDYSGENVRFLGGGDVQCFKASSIAANSISFKSLDGSWRHPVTGDLYVVDGGCGMLYRIDGAAFDPACAGAFGSCGGQVHFLTDLAEEAELLLNNNTTDGSSKFQNVPLAGDVTHGILYAAYGSQGGIMALDLANGTRRGWAVASNVPLQNGSFLVTPICGFMGDDGPAVGAQAALSCDVRQILVDPSTGDLYIADTDNHVIRKVDYATKIISTVTGTGFSAYTGDGGQAIDASLSRPSGLALIEIPDPAFVGGVRKMLYIADTGNGAVRRALLTGRDPKASSVVCEENVDQCTEYAAPCFDGGSSRTCAACNLSFYLDVTNNLCSTSKPLTTGTNVTEEFVDQSGQIFATLIFANVTIAGYTNVTNAENMTSVAPFPEGFQAGSTVYDIQTTGTYDGGVEVCLRHLNQTWDNTSTPTLLHYEGNVWVDITTSYNVSHKAVCGYTDQFSPFVLGFIFPPDQDPTMTSGKILLEKGFKYGQKDRWMIQTKALLPDILVNYINVTLWAANGAAIDTIRLSSSDCRRKALSISCMNENGKLTFENKKRASSAGVYTMTGKFLKRTLPALEGVQTPLRVSVDVSSTIVIELETTSCSLARAKRMLTCR